MDSTFCAPGIVTQNERRFNLDKPTAVKKAAHAFNNRRAFDKRILNLRVHNRKSTLPLAMAHFLILQAVDFLATSATILLAEPPLSTLTNLARFCVLKTTPTTPIISPMSQRLNVVVSLVADMVLARTGFPAVSVLNVTKKALAHNAFCRHVARQSEIHIFPFRQSCCCVFRAMRRNIKFPQSQTGLAVLLHCASFHGEHAKLTFISSGCNSAGISSLSDAVSSLNYSISNTFIFNEMPTGASTSTRIALFMPIGTLPNWRRFVGNFVHAGVSLSRADDRVFHVLIKSYSTSKAATVLPMLVRRGSNPLHHFTITTAFPQHFSNYNPCRWI